MFDCIWFLQLNLIKRGHREQLEKDRRQTFCSMFRMGCSFPSPLGFFSLSFGRWTWRRSDLLDLILKGGKHYIKAQIKLSVKFSFMLIRTVFLTVPLWFFSVLFLISTSSLSLLAPEASCCPGPHEYTARGNPDKQRAEASEGLAESSCPTSAAGPSRLNKAPERWNDK